MKLWKLEPEHDWDFYLVVPGHGERFILVDSHGSGAGLSEVWYSWNPIVWPMVIHDGFGGLESAISSILNEMNGG